MFLNLTDLSAEPLHNQISRQLTDKIVDGDLDDGDELMPIRTLARTQHVSVNTVKRAYDDLEREGLIQSREGKGFFVAPLTPEQKQAIAMQRRLGRQSLLNVVEIFSKELISVFDPEKLRAIIGANLKNHLQIQNVYFTILDDRTHEYTLLPSPDHPEKNTIQNRDPLLKMIHQSKGPLKMETLPILDKNNALLREMVRRDVRIIVPLKEADQLLGFLALSGKTNESDYTSEETNLLIVLANQFVTALTTARFYVEAVEKRRMDEELSMARQIQADLLPKEMPEDERFSMAGYSEPSHTVGGDFFDVIPIDENRWGLVIGDACGKGLPAAMLISQIQAMFKSEINNGNSIQQILENVNRQVTRFTPKDKFITLFYGVFNKLTGEFEYTTAGHNYPIHIGEDGSCETLRSGGPALGLVDDTSFEIGKIRLHGGDTLFLYTDGVVEAMNVEMEEYTEDRLINLLIHHRQLDSQAIVDVIRNDLNTFTGEQTTLDDRTMLILKII